MSLDSGPTRPVALGSWGGRRWTALSYLWAIFVGIATTAWIYGIEFVLGDPVLVGQTKSDAAAGLAAFRLYVGQDWGWPLLHVENFGDAGVNVAFSDSIPLLALVAKLLDPLGLRAETWWAGWYTLSYVLQAMAGLFAVRAWGGRSVPTDLATPVLVVTIPMLLLQIGHPSLSAQFILLAAWGLIGRSRTQSERGHFRYWLTALTLVAFAIHPYLGLMVFVMAGGAVADSVVWARISSGSGLRWLATTVVVVAGWLWIGGYLSMINPSGGGYGRYTASILGFFVPSGSAIIPLADDAASHPGFTYLGLGLVVVIAAGVWSERRLLGRLVQRNPGLTTAVMAMFAWAVTPFVHVWSTESIDVPAFLASMTGSTRRAGIVVSALAVGVSGYTLARLHRPLDDRRRPTALSISLALAFVAGVLGLVAPAAVDGMAEQFRASGRFAWPLGYGLVVMGLVSATKGWPTSSWGRSTVLGLAILGAVGLQLIDTTDHRARARYYLIPGGETRQRELADLAKLIEGHSTVQLEPDFRCLHSPAARDAFVDITHSAALTGRPINRVYSARSNPLFSCPVDVVPEFVDPETIWFFVEPVDFADDDWTRTTTREHCRSHDETIICTRHWVDVDPEVAGRWQPQSD